MVLKEILSTSMESALYHKVSFEKRPDLLPNNVFIFLRPIYTSIFNCSVYSCYHYFIILYSKGISCINMTLYEFCFPYFKLLYFVHYMISLIRLNLKYLLNYDFNITSMSQVSLMSNPFSCTACVHVYRTVQR